ncbi:MAG: hypothetical protein DHS20C18_05040 [Saprospiraceae bacterium]|nr:MAG: hypothetical protein DHS20C18_05040 [Saprospiraceae bacterium]
MIVLFFFLSLVFTYESNQANSAFAFGYNLDEPNGVFELENDLLEISGLGMASQGKELVAIQDEKGVIYFVSRTTGKITRKVEFWKNGDYEGIEMVDDKVYVVKSTGTIYEVNLENEKVLVEKFNDDDLGKDNDVEGLGYDRINHQLLLACKADAGMGKHDDFEKAIYGFNLKTKKLNKNPVFIIKLKAIQDYLQKSPDIEGFDKLSERFLEQNGKFSFHPSALAIHPQSGHLYICSSTGKMLLILDKDGRVLHIAKMKKKIHEQPEGICFAPDGTLYISNEGKYGQGKVYCFNQNAHY